MGATIIRVAAGVLLALHERVLLAEWSGTGHGFVTMLFAALLVLCRGQAVFETTALRLLAGAGVGLVWSCGREDTHQMADISRFAGHQMHRLLAAHQLQTARLALNSHLRRHADAFVRRAVRYATR